MNAPDEMQTTTVKAIKHTIDRSKLKGVLGKYKMGDAGCADAALVAKVRDYKAKVASRFFALGEGEIRKRLGTAEAGREYVVSRKLDGEFHCLFYDGNDAYLIKPSGTVLHGLKCINDAASALASSKVGNGIIAGELYVKKGSVNGNARERVFDVISATRSPQSENDLENVHFAPFDILELDGKNYVPSGPTELSQKLSSIFGKCSKAMPVQMEKAKCAEEIAKLFNDWVKNEGSEGLVVRCEHPYIYKIKPSHTVDAAIIGYIEGSDDRKGLVKSILVALMRSEGVFQVLGRVGTGFSDVQRSELLEKMRKLEVESEFIEVDSDSMPYKMVKPEIIVEAEFVDLITSTSGGRTIYEMVLTFEGKYRILRRMPFVSMIHPTFVRFRDDKRATPSDLRISQVSDLVQIDDATKNVEKESAKEAEVMLREVYTKELKGKKAVRKILVWKTNREGDSYAAYTLAYTDFSPNRAEPLEREIKVSNSKEQIMKLAEACRAENVKKGWLKVN